jgi:hypothetical protein
MALSAPSSDFSADDFDISAAFATASTNSPLFTKLPFQILANFQYE